MSEQSESKESRSFDANCKKIVAKHIVSVGGGTTRFTFIIDMKSPIQVKPYGDPFYKATFRYYSLWMGNTAPVEKCWDGYCTYVDITSESVHAYVVFSDPEAQDRGNNDEEKEEEDAITHTYDRLVVEIASYPRLRKIPPYTAIMEKYLTTMGSDDTFNSNGVVVIRDFFAPGQEIEEFCKQWLNGRELFISTE